MSSTISQLIRTTARLDTPADLEQRVMERIRTAMRRRMQARLLVFSMSALAGIGALAELGTHVVQAFIRSGFYQYLKLPFTDGAALALWKELGMSLLESLPIVSVIALLAALAFVIWAGAHAITSGRKAASLSRFSEKFSAA